MLIAYAIVKHQFLDIEVIIKKTLVFAGLFGMVAATATVMTVIAQSFVGETFSIGPRAQMIITGLFILALYQPTRYVLVHLTDRFLFQKKRGITAILNQLAGDIVTILDINHISKTILLTLRESMRLESGAILVRDKESGNFQIQDAFGVQRRPVVFPEKSSFIAYFNHPDSILVADGEDEGSVPEELRETMADLKAEVAVPLFSQNELNGVLTLGKKISDQDYTAEEMSVFPTLASQVAIALSNAKLLDEVVSEREQRLRAESEAKMVNYAKTIGHEIKNALVGIEGPAIFLQAHQAPDLMKLYEKYMSEAPEGAKKKFLDTVSKVEKQGKAIGERVEKIRVITSTAQGTLKARDEDFAEIYFKILWASAKDEAKIKGFQIESQFPENFVIFGNLILLQRVFTNLLVNTLEAMGDQEEKKIWITGRYKQDGGKQFAQIEYRDNGPGIPKDIQAKIFEQGFSTKPKPDAADIQASGHGQGMYVIKETVEVLHKGKLTLASEPGHGAQFTLTLPFPA